MAVDAHDKWVCVSRSAAKKIITLSHKCLYQKLSAFSHIVFIAKDTVLRAEIHHQSSSIIININNYHQSSWVVVALPAFYYIYLLVFGVEATLYDTFRSKIVYIIWNFEASAWFIAVNHSISFTIPVAYAIPVSPSLKQNVTKELPNKILLKIQFVEQ